MAMFGLMTCGKCGYVMVTGKKTGAGENIFCCPNTGCERFGKDYLRLFVEGDLEVRDDDPPGMPPRKRL